jgi:membrane-associated phospholipid phosphatase
MWLWTRGRTNQPHRAGFQRMMRAFAYLNFAAILIYLLMPVAPPWWVSLNGMTPPTTDLLSQMRISTAMDGKLVTGLIRNATQWFAAVPSLHGAYPVLLVLLSWRKQRWPMVAVMVVYALLMWAATVVLNQHYVIDLIAGGLLAVGAFSVSEWQMRRARRTGRAKTASALRD